MSHLTRMLPNSTLGYSARSDVQLAPLTDLRWCRFKVFSNVLFAGGATERRCHAANDFETIKILMKYNPVS